MMPLVFLICAVVISWYIYRVKLYRSLDNYPGPSRLELIKFTFLTKNNIDIYNYLISLNNKYGSVVKIWMKPFRPSLMVSNKKFVETILNSPDFVHKTDTYRLFQPLLGEGLVNMMADDVWKKDRRALGYAFNVKSMEKYAMRYKHHAEKLIKDLTSNTNTSLDVAPLSGEYSFNVVLDLLVGDSMSTNSERKLKLIKSVDIFRAGYLDRAYSLNRSYDFIFKLKSFYKEFQESCAYARDFVEEILNKHIDMRSNPNQNRDDFLSLLLNCNLPHIRTLDHLVTFILGGTETTGKAIAFCLFEIAKRPDVQQQILDEYDLVIGDSDDITFADIQNMHYTEAIVKEVLRMYPMIPIIQRQLLRSAVVDGVTIPAGTEIYFNILRMQNSEEYFDRPTEFDPTRFQPGNEGIVPPNVYIPFSNGPRDCIGKKVAMTEIKFIISYILKHFEIHPVYPEHKLVLVAEFTLDSANGIPVIFKKRTV